MHGNHSQGSLEVFDRAFNCSHPFRSPLDLQALGSPRQYSQTSTFTFSLHEQHTTMILPLERKEKMTRRLLRYAKGQPEID